ncbi:sensor histidine kinase [Actinomycetota bacterium Odt1-20B]
MVGRMWGVRRGWHERSKVEKVELQSVIMWHLVPWIFFACYGALPLAPALRPEPAPIAVGGALLAAGAAQCVHVNYTVRRSLDRFLGRGGEAETRRDLAVSAALLGITLTLLVALEAVHGMKDGLLGLIVMFPVLPFGGAYCLTVPIRTYMLRMLALDAVLVAAFAAVGARDERLVLVAGPFAFGALLALLCSRCGAWTLSVMWETVRAREVEARLAVAEERLRFGRDLHDVMGRNLAVIALKSELAVQLARRGRPEAVDQMVEVQRIAQESQREVREVVRGYRATGLGAELVGAQGVLAAAGIECRVAGADLADRLPPTVQSALGWVVREAATNVLRHGDPTECRVTLRVAGERAVLTVENDGVPEATATTAARSGGSGLAGLRERLASVAGTLTAGPAGKSEFLLTAEVPLPERDPSQGDHLERDRSTGDHSTGAEEQKPGPTRVRHEHQPSERSVA